MVVGWHALDHQDTKLADCIQELSSIKPGMFACAGVVDSLSEGSQLQEVGWLFCPPTCQGSPHCISMCCPPDQWFDGDSCTESKNISSMKIELLQEENYNFEWSGYYNSHYSCDPDKYDQVTIAPDFDSFI